MTHYVQTPFTRAYASVDKDTRSVYPMTLFSARYGGTYEGAPFIALPTYNVPSPAQGDDCSCGSFFTTLRETGADDYMGRGDTPGEAYDDLVDKLLAQPPAR